jgi:hypothetical protein
MPSEQKSLASIKAKPSTMHIVIFGGLAVMVDLQL